MRMKPENVKTAERHFLFLASQVKPKETASSAMIIGVSYGLAMYLKLARLERKANNDAVQYCNGEIDSEKWEIRTEQIVNAVNKIFGREIPGLFVNGDPRGYSLKIKEEKAKELGMYTDCGGYGILAPEF